MRLNDKWMNFSVRQVGPLRNGTHNNDDALDDVEMQFLADVAEWFKVSMTF